MNEKLQYATMLEIPVNTANVTYKPIKKRRSFRRKAKNPEAVKQELLSKVNAENERETAAETFAESAGDTAAEIPTGALTETASVENAETNENYADGTVNAVVHKKERGHFFKFTAVTAEVIAVFALIAAIFLTNAFYADSAINVFMRKVFSPAATETVREKTYDEFAPVVNFGGDVSLSDGVISCSGSGAVYAPVGGTVSSVAVEEDGTYTMGIAASGAFSAVLSGLTYAYLGVGDKVYGNIPVGYVKDGGFTVCFNSENGVITDYTLQDNAVLWAV